VQGRNVSRRAHLGWEAHPQRRAGSGHIGPAQYLTSRHLSRACSDPVRKLDGLSHGTTLPRQPRRIIYVAF
jgi:hypothetical protein